MKNITCGHLLSVSLIRKRLGEMGVNIYDMTLPKIEPYEFQKAKDVLFSHRI